MAQQAKEASQLPVPDRYYAEYVRLLSDAAEEGASLETLQEAINRGTRQSWNLVSVTQDPTSRESVLTIWDTVLPQGVLQGVLLGSSELLQQGHATRASKPREL